MSRVAGNGDICWTLSPIIEIYALLDVDLHTNNTEHNSVLEEHSDCGCTIFNNATVSCIIW